MQHMYDTTMKDVVKALREGWHGNGKTYPATHPLFKRSVDCRGLWRTCLKYARTIYVPIREGINGEVGSLVVDESHTDELCDIPIDTLVLDLTKEDIADNDFGSESLM